MPGVKEVRFLENRRPRRVMVTGNPDGPAIKAVLEKELQRMTVTIVESSAAPVTTFEPPPLPASHPAEPAAAQPFPQPRYDQISPPRPRGGGGLPQEGFHLGDGGNGEWAQPGVHYAALPQETFFHPGSGGSERGQQSAAPPAQQWDGQSSVPYQEWTVPWETGEYRHTPNAPTEIFNQDNANGCYIQ